MAAYDLDTRDWSLLGSGILVKSLSSRTQRCIVRGKPTDSSEKRVISMFKVEHQAKADSEQITDLHVIVR